MLFVDNGTLFSWGSGNHGALGHGSTEDVADPKLVESLSSVVVSEISCGWVHTAVVAGGFVVIPVVSFLQPKTCKGEGEWW